MQKNNQQKKKLLLPIYMLRGSDYIKCFMILILHLSRYYAEVCNMEETPSDLWRATQLLLKKCCSGGNTVSDLTGLKYEPPNPEQLRYCSTNWPVLIWLNLAASEIAVSTKTCIWYKYCNKFEISLQTKRSYKRLFEEHTQTLGKSCCCIFFHPKNLLNTSCIIAK